MRGKHKDLPIQDVIRVQSVALGFGGMRVWGVFFVLELAVEDP